MLKHPFGIYKFTIKSYHSDQNGKLTLSSLFHFLQECAWDNARANDFGFEYLEKQNAIWVLSRVLVQMKEYPVWKDEIEIKTWPKSVEGFFAIRDFQISNNEKVIGNVTSYWLILDKDTKRPQKLDRFNFIHENFIREIAIDKKLGKILIDGQLNKIDKRKVYQSDLDVNKHVNNATYVKWVLDSYYTNDQAQISEFEINFNAELMLNEEFEVFEIPNEGDKVFVLKNYQEKEICRARLK